MKKNYLKPEVLAVELETSVLAASIPVTDEEVDAASNRNQNRGEWGNVWK